MSELARPAVVGTGPEKGSQEGAPEEVVAYFSEDVSTTFAWFTLVGPKGEMEGELTYYSESPCEPEGPSCYRLTRQLGTSPPRTHWKLANTRPKCSA